MIYPNRAKRLDSVVDDLVSWTCPVCDTEGSIHGRERFQLRCKRCRVDATELLEGCSVVDSAKDRKLFIVPTKVAIKNFWNAHPGIEGNAKD